MSLPNRRSLYFGLRPINCLRNFGYKPIPSCNCSGKERKFHPVRICIQTVILKGWSLVLLNNLLNGYFRTSSLIKKNNKTKVIQALHFTAKFLNIKIITIYTQTLRRTITANENKSVTSHDLM